MLSLYLNIPPSFTRSLVIQPLAYPSDFRPVLREVIRSFIFFELNSDGLPLRSVNRPNEQQDFVRPQQSLFPLREPRKVSPKLLEHLSWSTVGLGRFYLLVEVAPVSTPWRFGVSRPERPFETFPRAMGLSEILHFLVYPRGHDPTEEL